MVETALVDSRLHAAWLSQLVREFRDICFQYRVPLQLPVLTISRSHTQLGSWSATDRRLCLSHFLISARPWATTLCVLKHEMAHQLCSELHGRDDVAHGPLFREACARLGLDEPFQRAGADLHHTLPTMDAATSATEPGRQVIDRVRKLMALGQSDNEHEAALALQRAQALLERHRLDFASLAESEQLLHRSIDTGATVLPAHRKVICTLLEAGFGVRVICASIYHPHSDSLTKTIELFGTEEAVAIAEHCYHFLENRLTVLWAKNRRRFAGTGRTARRSYFLGVLAGFREQLHSPASPGPGVEGDRFSGNHLPAVQTEARLDAFVAYHYPRLQRRRGRGQTLHGDAYHQAVADGRELTLRRPVDGAAPPRLLTK